MEGILQTTFVVRMFTSVTMNKLSNLRYMYMYMYMYMYTVTKRVIDPLTPKSD